MVLMFYGVDLAVVKGVALETVARRVSDGCIQICVKHVWRRPSGSLIPI